MIRKENKEKPPYSDLSEAMMNCCAALLAKDKPQVINLKRRWKILFLLFSFCTSASFAEEKPFVIVATPSNDKEVSVQDLNAIFCQNYSNYRTIYFVDALSDESVQRVENYIIEKGLQDQVILYKNRSPKTDIAHKCQAIFSCEKNEIIVDLNRGQRLPHADTLTNLNQIYSNPEVWMTSPSESGFTTFYASLFQAIDKQDFLEEGHFKSSDLTYLTPIYIMAGDHIFNAADHQLGFYPSVVEQALTKPDQYQHLSKLPNPLLDENSTHAAVYAQISDLLHPRIEDYQLLHQYLFSGYRPFLERLGMYYWGQRTLRLIGDSADDIPHKGLIHVNSAEENKENCVILYCTYNRNYSKGLQRLIDCIRQSDYQGDILFQIGGWPDVEGGSLCLSHVPYAFKPAFFREAQRLGYKRVLWLDVSVVPIASLNQIFAMIAEQGYFVMGNAHFVGPYVNWQTAAYFGMTVEETYQVPCCSSGLFGVDFTKQIGRRLIDHWYRSAQDPDAFFSSRPDQNTLSIILYQLNLPHSVDLSCMPHAEINDPITPSSLFYLDRLYVR